MSGATGIRASGHVTLLTVLLIVLVGAGCSRPVQQVRRPVVSLGADALPLGQLPRTVIPLRYRIGLVVNPLVDRFSGHVEIDVKFSQKTRAVFLHGRGLNVLAASVRLSARRSIPAHYVQLDKSGIARLIFLDEVPEGKATLVFDYDAPFGRSLSGLYKVVDQGDAYAVTQFEPISAREAFPAFDEPGFKTPFQISVVAPSVDRVISNTPILSLQRIRGGSTSTMFQWTKPLPTYLVELAVGPFDVVDGGNVAPNQFRSRPIHLRGITARGEGQRIRYALSLTPRIVSALESYFGVSFPFPKLDLLAIPDFAPNAMENAGAITFRERLLLLDPDASIEQKRSTLSVQAHEITHQWFGDLVTPSWWDDIWLNEAFANWMEYKIAQQVMPDAEFETETLRGAEQVMDTDELPSARRIRQPVHDAYDIENAFDGITYAKGAATLLMFESFLGPELFRAAVHAYLVKHAFGNAAAVNFIDAVAGAAPSNTHANPENVTISIDRNGTITWNGHPIASMAALIDQESHMAEGASPAMITRSFHSFIEQPGVPYVHVGLHCNEAATASVTQQAFAPAGFGKRSTQWQIPVCLGVESGERFCRVADRKVIDVVLGATCPGALMPNMDGKGYYRFALDEANWAVLIASATRLDPSNQIALIYNLSAAMRVGDAMPADLLSAVKVLAPTARWDVLAAIDDVLQRLRNDALAPAGLASYREFVASNFGRRFEAIGLSADKNEKPSRALERKWLARLMVTEARDPQSIERLAAAALAYLQGDVIRAPAPDVVGEALRAGLFGKGAPFADLAVQSMEISHQEYYRQQVVYGFAGSDDPSLVAKLLAAIPRMRTGELRYFYQYMSIEPVARQAFWSWYKRNYEGLLSRVSRDGMASAPSILSDACNPDAREDLDAFFAAKTATLTGTPRTLAIADEKIERCVAFRQARGADVAAALRLADH